MSRQAMHTGTRAAAAVLLLAMLLQACGDDSGGSAGDGDDGGGSGDGGGGSGGGGQEADPPLVSIGDATLTEGDGGAVDLVFPVDLSIAADADVTVDYASGNQSATAGEDYTDIEDTLTIPAGQTSASIAVPVKGDACYEEDETFSVTLANPSSNAALQNAVATGTIDNDDSQAELSLADSELPEGDTGTSHMVFTAGLDRESCFAVEGNYSTSSVTADDKDLAIEIGSFTVPAGEEQVEIRVEIQGDELYETDETFTLNLEDVSSHVAVADDEAFGTIRTDDYPPVLVFPVEMLEGNDNTRTMVFPVEVAGLTNEISVDYATSDVTATVADQDYIQTEGTLTLPAGVRIATIEVEIVGDTDPELIEILKLTLTDVQGDAVLIPDVDDAEGKILDDDTAHSQEPEIFVPQAFGFEDDDPNATTEMPFFVTLNMPVAGDVTLDYSTLDRSAVAGADYISASGSVTIPAGEIFAVVPIAVRGDDEAEGPEDLGLQLDLVTPGLATLVAPEATGTILDDDVVGPAFLSVQRADMFEGDSGVRDMIISVVLGRALGDTVTVDYTTRDATALAGSDYGVTSGTLTFQPGETLQTFAVPIFGDTVIEAHEHFEIVLSNVIGPAIQSTEPGEAIIESDDPFAMVSIDDVVLVEGDGGTADMQFTVSLDAPAADPVTMDYASADAVTGDSATANADYIPASGTVTVLPGETEATITVQINGDSDNEFDETFTVTLSNVSQNAELADPAGEGVIVNDDETPGWGLPRFFASPRDDNVVPRIAMNAAGVATVVWAPNNFGPYTSSRYSGGWGPLEQPPETSVSGIQRMDRDFVIDGAGRTTLIWALMPEAAQHTTVDGWDSSPFLLNPTSTNDAEYVALAGNEAGSVVAVWKHNDPASLSTDHLMFSVYDPASGLWSDADYIVFQGAPIVLSDVAMNEDGTAVVVWREGAIRASVYDPVTGEWSDPTAISVELSPGVHGFGYSPGVAIDDDGNAIAVWDTGLSLGTSVIGDVWASRYDADAPADPWGEPIRLELGILDATHPQIAMDGAGNAFVVWMQDNDPTDPWNDTFEIRARRYDVAADLWEPEVVVQDSNTPISSAAIDLTYQALDVPALAVDPAGNALLAWSEEINGEFVIRASRYDITAPLPEWGAPEPISDGTYAFAMLPDIAIDAAGDAIVVWQASDDEDFEPGAVSHIGWNRYTAP